MNDGLFYLTSSVLCNVSVSVLFKYARQYGVDIRQAIAANYLVALLLCWLTLDPSMAVMQAPDIPWVVLLLLGVLLPTVFVAMFNAVRFVGVLRTDAAQRLSLFIPLLASFLLFDEAFTTRKGMANDPAIVFSAMNIGVISLGAVAGVVLFRERMSPVNTLGLTLAVASVALMIPR